MHQWFLRPDNLSRFDNFVKGNNLAAGENIHDNNPMHFIVSVFYADRNAGRGCHGDEPHRVPGANTGRWHSLILSASPVDMYPETLAGLTHWTDAQNNCSLLLTTGLLLFTSPSAAVFEDYLSWQSCLSNLYDMSSTLFVLRQSCRGL